LKYLYEFSGCGLATFSYTGIIALNNIIYLFLKNVYLENTKNKLPWGLIE